MKLRVVQKKGRYLCFLSLVVGILFISGCESQNKGDKCPTTSCEAGNCCHSVNGGVGVSGVITREPCDCPQDTDFAQKDMITQGGPYNICKCKSSE